MIYEITEDELNNLRSIRSQVRLIVSLVDISRANGQLHNLEDLGHFLDAQSEALSEILRTVDERQEVRGPDDSRPSWIDWANALTIVSGGDAYPQGAIPAIQAKLRRGLQVDPDMAAAMAAWQQAIVRVGAAERAAAQASKNVKAPAKRKRERLVQEA